ncbi:hypothetical protein [Streptomyces sp. NPDC000134]|uniref:hypothetical protein n=1 Tax=Streptomyces sp. NPDC000134 TaxID=3364536 RepID=UPI0036771405
MTEHDLIVSPVGADRDLREALEDLKLGRYHTTGKLLAATGRNWPLRTNRSRLLAAGAGDGGVFKVWLDEQPHSVDASMMWARVLTRAALSAWRRRADRQLLWRAAVLARDACLRTIELDLACPVPWICLLQLTALPFEPYLFDPAARHRRPPWGQSVDPTMPYEGPWPLLDEIVRRDPGSREGHHRMRQFFQQRGMGAAARDYAFWVASGRPDNGELLMLPVYALVDWYLEQHGDGRGGALHFWQSAQVRHYACRARDGWFAQVPPTEWAWLPLVDLSYLAYVLMACGEDAVEVFAAMGRYVTPEPWQQVNASLGRSYDWRSEYVRIRNAAMR